MSERGTCRPHAPPFKIQVGEAIRSGSLVRHGAREKYNLSANLIQHSFALYDRGELVSEEAEAAIRVEYQAKIAALARRFGQLTMELGLLKKRRRRVSSAATSVRPSLAGPRPLLPSGE